jgi:hypothetical protein
LAFDYVTQTGKNTTADSKVSIFTTGIELTTNSSLGYSVLTRFVNSHSYTLTLTIQGDCSLTSFSFTTLLLDQAVTQSTFDIFIQIGQSSSSDGSWSSLSVTLPTILPSAIIIGLNDFCYGKSATSDFSLTIESNSIKATGKASFSTFSFNYFHIFRRSCTTTEPYLSPIDNLCYDICPIGQQSNSTLMHC